MTERCDVVVVGGGPAGAATAIPLTEAGRSVVVLERSQYDQMRLGETLPPVARTPLANLGAWHRFVQQEHAPSPAIIAAWGTPEVAENHFIFNPHGHGWHLDRRRFDEMLASVAADCGASVRPGSRATACHPAVSGGWDVEYRRGAAVHRLRATFLVDATGRASLLARRLGATRMSFDRLTGVIGVCSVSVSGTREHARDEDHRTLVESAADGWWYSALLPGSLIVVAYMTDADLVPKNPEQLGAHWRSRLESTTHTRSRVRGLTFDGPLRVMAARSERLDRMTGPNWLATGDAAVSVDPLSSQGILFALRSGLAAARAIEESYGGSHFALAELSRSTRQRFAQYWQMRRMHYSREQRWLDSVFWRRRREEM
jgi:flavin-dependent dehydrogenase